VFVVRFVRPGSAFLVKEQVLFRCLFSIRAATAVLAAWFVLCCVLRFHFTGREHNKENELLITPESLILGEILENDSFIWPINFYNNTDETLHVDKFVTSCSCTTINPERIEISPRSFATCYANMNLMLNPTGVSSHEEVSIEVEPVLRGKARYRFSIAGKVQRVLVFDSQFIDFGSVREKEPLLKSLRVSSMHLLKGVDVQCKSEEWSSSTIKEFGSKAFIVNLSCKNKLPSGAFHSEIIIRPISADGVLGPGYKINVQGFVLPGFKMSPPGLIIGSKAVGMSVDESVSIVATTEKKMKILTAYADRSDTSICLSEKSSNNFTVRQLISSEGRQRRTITISILTEDDEQRTIAFPIEYFGLRQQP